MVQREQRHPGAEHDGLRQGQRLRDEQVDLFIHDTPSDYELERAEFEQLAS